MRLLQTILEKSRKNMKMRVKGAYRPQPEQGYTNVKLSLALKPIANSGESIAR